jgi:putative redox protein
MIRLSKSNNLSFFVANDRHTILTDVSVSEGGDDLGLTPHELLEASLGACTNITIMMYAKRKNWPVQDVQTKVTITNEVGENNITMEIKLIGELDQAQRDRLFEISKKCPMHKLLLRKTNIETNLI